MAVGMKALFYRPIQLVALAFIVLLLLALIILGGLTWRDQRRLQSIHQSVDYTHAIQRISLDLQDILLEELAGTAAVNREQLLRMDAEVAKLSTASGALVRDTSKQLAEVRLLLTDPQQPPRISLAKAIELMRHIVYDEIEAVSRLLVATDHDAKAEFQLVTATILVLVTLAG
jgi:two-component system NtrC family sensor kinase